MIVQDIFNKKQVIVNYSIPELIEIYYAGKMEIREVSARHVRNIKNYLIKNNPVENIFLTPMIAYITEGQLSDGKPQSFAVIDGSTRMKALLQLEEYLKNNSDSSTNMEYVFNKYLLETFNTSEIAVHFYEGLSKFEINQLYIDFNTKGKKSRFKNGFPIN